jgi:alpha-1,2-mannosyltransferase
VTVAGKVRNRPAGASPAAALGIDGAVPVYLVIAAFTVAAVFLRFFQLLRPGYLLGMSEYDDGVLFGNAVRLVNGVIPYRDFAVVQPPGGIVLMTPVALLTKVSGTTDGGLGIARILTAAADCACVPLLGLLVRHRGALAAGVACGIYAVYPDALIASHTFLLEPWLNLFCLIGAVWVFNGDWPADGRRLAWGGLAFGFAAAVKIWALVPLAVIGFLVLHQRGPRRLLLLAGGAMAGLGIAFLPFLILAPGATVKDAIISQLIRSGGGSGALLPRLTDMAGLSLFPHLPKAAVVLILLMIAAAVSLGYMLVCMSTGRFPAALDWYVLVGGAAVILMLLWPYGYYTHYGAFAGPFIALALALLVGLMRPVGRGDLIKTLAAGAAAAALIGGMGLRQLEVEVHLQPWANPAVRVDRLIPRGACVVTNVPALTITANRFVPDTAGCPSLVDSYGTLIAMTNGRQLKASPQVLRSVDAFWRSAFAHATYVWLVAPTQGEIPWTRSLHDYFVSHFRLIGLASIHTGGRKIPRGGLYVHRQ